MRNSRFLIMKIRHILMLLGLIALINAWGAEEPATKKPRIEVAAQIPMVTLVSQEGQEFKIPLEVANQSETIRDLLAMQTEEAGSKTIILNLIDSSTLQKIVKLMQAFYEFKDLKGKALLDAVEKKVDLYPQELLPASYLVNLLRVASFLDLKLVIALIVRALIKNPITIKLALDLAISQKLEVDVTRELLRYYFLLTGGQIIINPPVSYGFSIQHYLDYQPQIITRRIKGTTVDLSGLQLNSIEGITAIPNSNTLTSIDLSSNQITDVTPLVALKNNLKELDLKNNFLTDITPLAQLHQLTKLDLSKNQITPEQRNILKKALPDVGIEF